MPDQAYMLPDEYESYRAQRELEEQRALEQFHERFGEDVEAVVNSDATTVYNFQSFFRGTFAHVVRKSDGIVGTLSWTDEFGKRVYYGFKPENS